MSNIKTAWPEGPLTPPPLPGRNAGLCIIAVSRALFHASGPRGIRSFSFRLVFALTNFDRSWKGGAPLDNSNYPQKRYILPRLSIVITVPSYMRAMTEQTLVVVVSIEISPKIIITNFTSQSADGLCQWIPLLYSSHTVLLWKLSVISVF